MADQEKEILEEETVETAEETQAAETVEESTEEAVDKKDGETVPEEEAEEETAPEGEDPKSWAEKRAAKKQAKQDKKADAAKERITELEDRVKRQLAEFENFRNRSEKEKQAMFETGARSVIEKILPVIDNFERGLATVPPEQQGDAFVEGMSKVYKQMMAELENIGVKPIEAVGCEFDPNLHNAVMQVENEELESGTVAQELQKGYTYRDTVVRHSMVSVVS
ncbi:MAG: nucleotide exchange factor GrpE [Lachnospiraceae bacterium]|nr:nucleotide exchange factor GrpE [Lachnospiraceae bacterium]